VTGRRRLSIRRPPAGACLGGPAADELPHVQDAHLRPAGGLDAGVAVLEHQAAGRVDADPLGRSMLQALPAPLRKRLAPSAAAEAIARGIERRSPRIIRPRRWALVSVLRGILNPLLDRGMESDARVQALTRELDARAGEDQPTTA